MTYKIGLLYDSYNDNVGDIAMGIAMKQAFRGEKDIECEIVNPFIYDVSRYDRIIIGGGQLLRKKGDDYYDAFRPEGEHILNAVGLSQPVDELEYLNRYSFVSTRTVAESEVIAEVVEDVQTIPCMTTILEHDQYKIPGLKKGEKVIGIHVVPYTLQLCPDFVDIINKIPHKKVLIPFTHYNHDQSFLSALPFDRSNTIILDSLSPLELHSVIGQMDYVVVSSLHATIFAYSQNVPFATLAQDKVVRYLVDRNLTQFTYKSNRELEAVLDTIESTPPDMSERVADDKAVLKGVVSRYLEIIRSKPPVSHSGKAIKDGVAEVEKAKQMSISLYRNVVEGRDRLLTQIINEAKESKSLAQDEYNKVLKQNETLSHQVGSLLGSREYRLGILILHPKRLARTVLGRVKTKAHDLYVYKLGGHNKTKDYFIDTRISQTPTDNRLAVVVHLYYTDNWPLFKQKLETLQTEIGFDLHVSIPKENVEFIDTLRADFPGVSVYVVPNRGRDVLPFVMVARELQKSGKYDYVLKFHSKKSTHRTDGQEWLTDMLDSLIPDEKHLVSIHHKLKNPETGVIGPRGFYYPLTVNLPGNIVHTKRVLKLKYPVFSSKRRIRSYKDSYGFFGGTMFWARMDAIQDLLKFSPSFFEREQGQIDGTFSHALERLFCLIPELDGKDIYEVSSKTLTKRKYASKNIPDWSMDHNKI